MNQTSQNRFSIRWAPGQEAIPCSVSWGLSRDIIQLFGETVGRSHESDLEGLLSGTISSVQARATWRSSLNFILTPASPFRKKL